MGEQGGVAGRPAAAGFDASAANRVRIVVGARSAANQNVSNPGAGRCPFPPERFWSRKPPLTAGASPSTWSLN